MVPVTTTADSKYLQAKAGGIIYLGCPYTHTERQVREQRFQAATEAAAALIRQGFIVYSPITMTHPIDVVLAGTTSTLGSNYWVTFDEAFMDVCSGLVVLTVDGWDKSNGIQREINYFKKQEKPIGFMDPGGYRIYSWPNALRNAQK